jgi:hypothetical protein
MWPRPGGGVKALWAAQASVGVGSNKVPQKPLRRSGMRFSREKQPARGEHLSCA